MEFAVFASLPGLVILLTVIAFVDQLMLRAGRAGVLPWRNGARVGQVSATGFEQLHGALSPGKQNELKERESALVLRDDEEDGAPPHRTRVDLDSGTAVLVMRTPPPRAQARPRNDEGGLPQQRSTNQ
ncbi:DUF6191 domain-containing protein [Streptomyces sp. NPDC057199]|uniref:DUF6191 domain-containing protein n=1 Tax=Streptomyces sp. NPDC057199 TaxID=3346047 RepID=UPI00363C047F